MDNTFKIFGSLALAFALTSCSTTSVQQSNQAAQQMPPPHRVVSPNPAPPPVVYQVKKPAKPVPEYDRVVEESRVTQTAKAPSGSTPRAEDKRIYTVPVEKDSGRAAGTISDLPDPS